MTKIEESLWTEAKDEVRQVAFCAAKEIGCHGGDSYQPSHLDSLLYIEDEIGVASLIVWRRWEDNLFVGIAWTRINVRRTGLYRRLLQRLDELANEQRLNGIGLCVHPNNTMSLMTHNALDFKQQYIYLERKAPPQDEPDAMTRHCAVLGTHNECNGRVIVDGMPPDVVTVSCACDCHETVEKV